MAVGEPGGIKSNRDGIGAKLRVVAESGSPTIRICQHGRKLYFRQRQARALRSGQIAQAKLLEITWPSGIVQQLESVEADQILTVREKA